MSTTRSYEAAINTLENKVREQTECLSVVEMELQRLDDVMKKEKMDVERLEEESFLTSFLKLLHLHEGKLSREFEEYLKAKLDYEKMQTEHETTLLQLKHLDKKIADLKAEAADYKEVLEEKQRQMLELPPNSPERVLLDRMLSKVTQSRNECIEIEEAITACQRAVDCEKSAREYFKKANDWATFDVIGGGILADSIKYNKINAGKKELEYLNVALKSLRKEMADVGDTTSLELANIDSVTQALDVWFDNIFSDYKVKHQVENQIEALTTLEKKLIKLLISLESRYEAAKGSLNASVEAFEQLLMD